jgi:annexin A13
MLLCGATATLAHLSLFRLSSSHRMEFLQRQELNKLLDFVAFRDANLIRKACAGLGTDDDLLISLLCQRTKNQIQAIARYYQQVYNKSLKQVIESECGGNYKRFLLFLCETRGEYLCNQIRSAMSGLGCDKSLVNELICLSTKDEVFEMKEIYERTFDKSLSDKLRSELGGEHEALILTLLLRGRGVGPVDLDLANDQAERIHREVEEGSGMFGGLSDSCQRSVSRLLPHWL